MFKIAVSLLLVFNSVNCFVISNENITITIEDSEAVDETSEYIITKNMENLRISFAYPGTKWCGPGNTASTYEDLGSELEADKCCRTHDYCPDLMEPGETKHNITNDAFYSRLECSCDEEFRQCLHTANTTTARRIGVFYFNRLGTKCFRNDYPTIKCLKTGGWLTKKCIEYSYDKSAEKLYQWFDVRNYDYPLSKNEQSLR